MAKVIISKGVDNGVFSIQFADGRELRMNTHELSDTIKEALFDHGCGQKIGDAASGCKGDINTAYAECSSTIDALMSGDWNRRGGGNGGVLLEAMIEHFSGEYDASEVTAKYSGMTKELRAQTRKHPSIQLIIKRLELERAEARAEGAEDLVLG